MVLEGLFLSRWSSDIITRPNMSKTKKMKNFQFGIKLMG